MIAEKASESIEKAVVNELSNIVKNYGTTYASKHEAYAILLEEFEEAGEDFFCLRESLNIMWDQIKRNQVPEEQVRLFKKYAIYLAQEAVQCAAVCERFLETIKREEKHD